MKRAKICLMDDDILIQPHGNDVATYRKGAKLCSKALHLLHMNILDYTITAEEDGRMHVTAGKCPESASNEMAKKMKVPSRLEPTESVVKLVPGEQHEKWMDVISWMAKCVNAHFKEPQCYKIDEKKLVAKVCVVELHWIEIEALATNKHIKDFKVYVTGNRMCIEVEII